MIDFTPIIWQVFSVAWPLVPLAILAGFIKSPWWKGKVGEWQVNTAAKLLLKSGDYILLKDVTLPVSETETTQIDHIIVSRYGVFVVETKNYDGAIYGTEKQKMWTQALNKHSKFKFQNPLRQNYKHTECLRTYLELPCEAIFSVIVFVGNADFKTVMPKNVTKQGSYIDYIKSKTDLVLSHDEVAKVVKQIESSRCERGLKTDREHIQRLNDRHQSKSDDSCQKCGSGMVVRSVKKGANAGRQFLGCSSFPKCRARRAINP